MATQRKGRNRLFLLFSAVVRIADFIPLAFLVIFARKSLTSFRCPLVASASLGKTEADFYRGGIDCTPSGELE